MALTAAVAGAVSIAAGVAWIYPPAGLICAGVEAICGAYAYSYLKARRGETARRPR